jgi:hypothetical protein
MASGNATAMRELIWQQPQHPETLVLHSGYRSDPATTAVAVAIYQTTSFQFHNTDQRTGGQSTPVVSHRMDAITLASKALLFEQEHCFDLVIVINVKPGGSPVVYNIDMAGRL